LAEDFICVQTEDFSVDEQYQAIRSSTTSAGAVVFFVGLVRDINDGQSVTGLHLEHYPAMTKKALAGIVTQARERWDLHEVRLIHRVGSLDLNDQIVFVATSSRHRQSAFQACEFIMDFLKTQAPFWKKERTTQGDHWVDARTSDQQELERWQK